MEELSEIIEEKNMSITSDNQGIGFIIVDKFISCVLLENSTINLRKYISTRFLNNHNDGFNDGIDLGYNIRLEINISTEENDINTNYKYNVFLEKWKIGIIYLSPRKNNEYFFKIDKDIFTSKKYSIKYLCNVFSNVFDENSSITGIVKLDIACDTIAPNFISNLQTIVDSAQNNHFFKSQKDKEKNKGTKERELNTDNQPVGRTFKDAIYKFKVPNLVVSQFKGSIYLGSLKGEKYFCVYEKDLKKSNVQDRYFMEKFGSDSLPITRIELRLQKQAVKHIEINKLDTYDYIKGLFLVEAEKYLSYYNVKDGRYYDQNRNLKWHTELNLMDLITILDNHHDFGENGYHNVLVNRSINKRKPKSIEKAKLTNVLKGYLNQPDLENLDKILDHLKNNPMTEFHNSFTSRRIAFDHLKRHLQESFKNKGFDSGKLNNLLVALEDRMIPSLREKIQDLNINELSKQIDNQYFGIKLTIKKKRNFLK
jgi:hypothetical protein